MARKKYTDGTYGIVMLKMYLRKVYRGCVIFVQNQYSEQQIDASIKGLLARYLQWQILFVK
jgi:hypothetical protein